MAGRWIDKEKMPYPFYTIGHSTRSIPEFVALLHVGEAKRVLD